jgi:hypothetical protein
MAENKPGTKRPFDILRSEWQVIASLLVISILNSELTSRIVHIPHLSPTSSRVISLAISAVLVVAVIMASWLKLPHISRIILVVFASFATIYLLSAINALVASLPNLTTSPAGLFLLRDAALVLGINVVLFAVWFWLIDYRGSQKGTTTTSQRRDFLFIQEVLPIPGWEGWHPDFSAYLTMSFYNSVTFGPTDTYVLSRRARFLIVFQVILSLIVLLTFVARAFVIIK